MKKLFLIAAILGTGFLASESQAQGYYYPQQQQNSYGYQGNNGGYSQQHVALGQNIYQLQQYGNYMTNNYAHEVRNYNGCRNSNALLSEMRRYNGYTTQLASAYRGSCPKTYKTRCSQVRTSLSRIQTLRRNARVSPTVNAYISRSCPVATYVSSNYGYYQPTRVYTNHRPVQAQRPACNSRGGGYSHSRDRGGIDVGSAILGAIAGRIIHGAIHRH